MNDKNILHLLPILQKFDDSGITTVEVISLWSPDVIGQKVPVAAVPFLKKSDVIKILKEVRIWCGDRDKYWADAVLEAIK